ncbi:Per os infectivity factor 3 [Lonomia obliqua multiple nucleopolyhedrovirus]|uniref:Per os infectivity factor 3 n=1 Tax=Lonomia obliqua multiple nucleopolyhedrovirus TaxID=134394 RepID=A0A126FCC4_9ABAC|nr:Per os infectivity factor 3 [Lonomia obliqua multiple nucleopolyhedrovirus]AKN81038.1 Per os infectivity factor 3 [Lonomia obliqua multiple nucleopolyhedrovirus]
MYTFKTARGLILNDNYEQTNISTNTTALPLFSLTFQRNRGINCALSKLPCVTDQQCRDSCVIAGATSEFLCEQGFCNVVDALVNAQVPDSIKCDPNLGLVRVYAAGGDFVVAQTCISTYRDLIDDTGVPRPYLCDNGTLTLNLNTVQFSTQSCECSEGYEKLLFNQTALARSIPVCIPLHLSDLFKKIYNKDQLGSELHFLLMLFLNLQKPLNPQTP